MLTASGRGLEFGLRSDAVSDLIPVILVAIERGARVGTAHSVVRPRKRGPKQQGPRSDLDGTLAHRVGGPYTRQFGGPSIVVRNTRSQYRFLTAGNGTADDGAVRIGRQKLWKGNPK